MDDLDRLVDRTRHGPLTDDEHAHLKAAIDTLGYVAGLLEQKGTTIGGLRQLLFGHQTEKTREVLARAGLEAPPPPTGHPAGADQPSAPCATPRHAAATAGTGPRRTPARRMSRCLTGTCITAMAVRCV